jgi:hypothetical protein
MAGLAIEAVDGPIGKLEQFFFDDSNWAIRYLVADIGTWLNGRRVLLSPAAIDNILYHALMVKNTKEQIQKSPDINTVNPFSREEEQKLHDYYAWPFYWIYPANYNSLGGALYPGLTEPFLYPSETAQEFSEGMRDENSPKSHLRKTLEVIGYSMQATDQLIGHVEDFIVDDIHWVIRYLVIDTGTILCGKKVLISPQWTKGIDWGKLVIYVDEDKETISQGPEYDATIPITRESEKRLYNYYEKPKYWGS